MQGKAKLASVATATARSGLQRLMLQTGEVAVVVDARRLIVASSTATSAPLAAATVTTHTATSAASFTAATTTAHATAPSSAATGSATRRIGEADLDQVVSQFLLLPVVLLVLVLQGAASKQQTVLSK